MNIRHSYKWKFVGSYRKVQFTILLSNVYEDYSVRLKNIMAPLHIYINCCLLLSVSTSHFTVCPPSVSNSHCTVCWFCIHMPTAFFYSLWTVCQYLTLYSLLSLSQYVPSCLLQSVHCLSVTHTVQSVGSVSLCTQMNSRVCRMSVGAFHCTVCPLSVTRSQCRVCPNSVGTQGIQSDKCLPVVHTVKSVHFLSKLLTETLSTVCQYHTIYSLLVLRHYVHCFLLNSD